jgi:hypothetical protein
MGYNKEYFLKYSKTYGPFDLELAIMAAMILKWRRISALRRTHFKREI